MSTPDKIWVNPQVAQANYGKRFPGDVQFTRTDLSQAAVAAALEAAAQTVDTLGDSAVTEALGTRLCCDGHMCGCQGADVGAYILHQIRALITQRDRDALAAHVAAEVAKARAEDVKLIAALHSAADTGRFYVDLIASGLNVGRADTAKQSLADIDAALAQIGAKP